MKTGVRTKLYRGSIAFDEPEPKRTVRGVAYKDYMRLYMRQYFIDKPCMKRNLANGWQYKRGVGWSKREKEND